MNARKSFELMKKYSACEDCGSETIGNGKGYYEVTDDTFRRGCECGWSVEVKEGE